jgi:hypothetical protein
MWVGVPKSAPGKRDGSSETMGVPGRRPWDGAREALLEPPFRSENGVALA